MAQVRWDPITEINTLAETTIQKFDPGKYNNKLDQTFYFYDFLKSSNVLVSLNRLSFKMGM